LADDALAPDKASSSWTHTSKKCRQEGSLSSVGAHTCRQAALVVLAWEAVVYTHAEQKLEVVM
jgi:hypothetical protein